ncbi:MAG: hypothetical protein WD768_13625 [Phycisphaeraceae bacterium]
MGHIAELLPSTLGERVAASNRDSLNGSQQYVIWESRAIQNDYEMVPCQCASTCWCAQHGCQGHYRLKPITFEQFLDRYVQLWAPPNARQILKQAVLDNAKFEGRQRRAVPPLQWLGEHWDMVVTQVRSHTRSGLCDEGVPVITESVTHLYDAKMWSQLYYDGIVPFDTSSRALMKRLGFVDPLKDFTAFNRQLFADLRIFAERRGLSVNELRRLDQPWTLTTEIPEPPGGQPLSRLLDKIFYSPTKK